MWTGCFEGSEHISCLFGTLGLLRVTPNKNAFPKCSANFLQGLKPLEQERVAPGLKPGLLKKKPSHGVEALRSIDRRLRRAAHG